jgi:hypothetical protein
MVYDMVSVDEAQTGDPVPMMRHCTSRVWENSEPGNAVPAKAINTHILMCLNFKKQQIRITDPKKRTDIGLY